MSKDKSGTSSNRSFRPMQGGYTAREGRGHVPSSDAESALPKAPRGGTGQTSTRSSSNSANAPSSGDPTAS